jgi:hypothetical protein
MTTADLRLSQALAALAGAVALAGCATPAAAPKTHPPTADSAPSGGTPVASDEALPPDQDGHPGCAAYDSWRPGPGGAGTTVTYWFEGAEPATVAVRQPANPDLTQTVGNDASQRHHDVAFIDADPTAVTEVLITTGDAVCYVRAGPPS